MRIGFGKIGNLVARWKVRKAALKKYGRTEMQDLRREIKKICDNQINMRTRKEIWNLVKDPELAGVFLRNYYELQIAGTALEATKKYAASRESK